MGQGMGKEEVKTEIAAAGPGVPKEEAKAEVARPGLPKEAVQAEGSASSSSAGEEASRDASEERPRFPCEDYDKVERDKLLENVFIVRTAPEVSHGQKCW